MGAIDLNKVAVCMGKVLKLLTNLQPYTTTGDAIYDHRDDFCFIAYVCRVGILDRIDNNSYMKNPAMPIKIPTGLFSSRKETMASALDVTIGQLKRMVEKDVITANNVEEILGKRGVYHAYNDALYEKVKGII